MLNEQEPTNSFTLKVATLLGEGGGGGGGGEEVEREWQGAGRGGGVGGGGGGWVKVNIATGVTYLLDTM